MNYFQIRNKTYKEYKKIKKAYCPYLKTDVVFNSKGFWHIIYRSRKTKRPIKIQMLRFKLLDKAVQVVKQSHTLQEYDSLNQQRKTIRYFGFIAIIDGWKIKVIVRQFGHGNPYFWSIIPNWITSRKRDKKLVMFKGDLDRD